MGRMYSVAVQGVSVSAAQDVFEIRPADDKPCVLHGLFIGQYSDAGDAQDELLSVRIIRGFTSSGSGGSTPTPTPMHPSDAAAGFSAEANNTTVATTGTTTEVHADAFNVRAGYQMIWTPEMRPQVGQGNTSLVVRITAPADAITMNATLYVEELG